MKITGKTKIVGIFGYPIEHTLSPRMHNAAFAAVGLDYVYLPFSVRPEDLKSAVRALPALGIAGINVTVPHKEHIIEFLDEIDPAAQFIGAVNTVKVENEAESAPKLVGYNTDAQGFLEALQTEGVNLRRLNVLLLGAGGAAKAVGAALMRSGVGGITIANRTRSKAQHLAAALATVNPYVNPQVIPWEPKRLNSSAKEAQLLVNATSLGLNKSDKLPITPKAFHNNQVVYDLVYGPKTWLQEQAAKKGAKVIGGRGMLLHQGAEAFQILTGEKAPLGVMKRALEESG